MPDTPVLDLRTLGAAFLRGPDGAVVQGLGAKSLGAIAYLALAPGGAAPRDVLVDLLWGRGAPEQGRASLRQELRRMKLALGPLFDAAIDTPGGQVALRPGAVRCDYLLAERACEARETAGLAALLELSGGAFLAPLSVPEIAFQDWQAERNSRFESLAGDALLRLLLLDESAGRLDRAAAAARALLALDPLQEDIHAALVRLHVAAGRPALARRQIDACRALFLEELGEPPESDLEALLPAPRPRIPPPGPTPHRPTPSRPARTRAAPAAPAAEGPARDPLPSDRPLLALDPAEPALAPLALDLAARLPALSGLRVAPPAPPGTPPRPADWRLALAAEPPGPGEAEALRLTLTRREAAPPSGAPAPGASCPGAPSPGAPVHATPHSRRLARAEGAPPLAPRLAAALAAELLQAERLAAEAAAALAPATPWTRLLALEAAMADLDPARLDAAREALEPDIRARPAEPRLWAALALSHHLDGREARTAPREAFFRARELALRAHRRAPDDPWAQHALGLAVAAMGDPEGGRLHQLRALARHPGFAPAEGELARLLALAGDRAEADHHAAQALATAPDDPAAPHWALAPALARFAAGDPAATLAALDGPPRPPATRDPAAAPNDADPAAPPAPGPEAPARAPARPRLPDDPAASLLRAAALLETGRDPAEALAASAPRRAAALSPAAALEALTLLHPFADPTRTEAFLAPLRPPT